ncbi:MAG TPA: hypothetical protein VFX30_14930 [bacterium]|nr:hypothetical protein [bacterium]
MFLKFLTPVLVAVLLIPASGWGKDKKSQDPGEAMQEAMDAAEAGAKRPGDESLSCDALQKELGTVMKDPSVQAMVAQAGKQSQKDMEKMKNAKSQVALGTASSVAGSLPGGDWAQLGAAMAQAPGQMAQAQQHRQEIQQMGGGMADALPSMMRGQRIMELAQAKKCEWAQQK